MRACAGSVGLTRPRLPGGRPDVPRAAPAARSFLVALALASMAGCATIPKQAPELSVALGQRIAALEESHLQLLGAFFEEKRAAVDRYIEGVWIPAYAAEVLKEPAVQALWDRVCREGTPQDRLEFLRRLGPKLQLRINDQRRSMVEPLDRLERSVGERLRSEYDQARSINNTLTSFLTSASAVEASRNRYVGMLGIHLPDVEAALGGADEAVGALRRGAERAEDAAQDVETYRTRMEGILATLRTAPQKSE